MTLFECTHCADQFGPNLMDDERMERELKCPTCGHDTVHVIDP